MYTEVYRKYTEVYRKLYWWVCNIFLQPLWVQVITVILFVLLLCCLPVFLVTFEVIEKVPAELKGSRICCPDGALVGVWHMESANGIISCGAEDTGIAAACISVGKPPVSLSTHEHSCISGEEHLSYTAVFQVKRICLTWSAGTLNWCSVNHASKCFNWWDVFPSVIPSSLCPGCSDLHHTHQQTLNKLSLSSASLIPLVPYHIIWHSWNEKFCSSFTAERVILVLML